MTAAVSKGSEYMSMHVHIPAAVSYREYAEMLAERNALLESAGAAMLRLDRDGRCVYVNGRAQQLLGGSIEDITRAIAASPELSAVIPACREARPMRGQSVVWGRDGSPVPVQFSVEPVVIAFEVVGAIVTFRDLREVPDHVEALLAQIPAGVMVTDASPGRVDRTNDRLAELFGIAVELRSHLRTVQDWPMEHLARGAVALREHPLYRALQWGESIQGEKYVVHPSDGGERIVAVNAAPIAYSGQKLRGAIAVFTDVTEREVLIRRLERANAGLKQSHSDLRRFALVAAHDLKEPLATIRKHTESITASGPGGSGTEFEDRLLSISSNCQRLTGLVNHMLTVAQVASAPLRLEPTPGETLVCMAVSQLQAQIEGEHARVLTGAIPEVVGDQLQLSRVLQNLISNAIRYRHPEREPEIHITGTESADEVRIDVRDNGCGLPEDERERIFEPYRRLHGEEIPGSGLGLWICRQLVERHGGRIWVESSDENGSVFSFALKRNA